MWLDVLCLRQSANGTRVDMRMEEWKLDTLQEISRHYNLGGIPTNYSENLEDIKEMPCKQMTSLENIRWRPSWNQVMNDALPSTNGNRCCEDVQWDDGKEAYRCSQVAWCIEKGVVRRLAMGDPQGRLRSGELEVKDADMTPHIFKIVATYQHPNLMIHTRFRVGTSSGDIEVTHVYTFKPTKNQANSASESFGLHAVIEKEQSQGNDPNRLRFRFCGILPAIDVMTNYCVNGHNKADSFGGPALAESESSPSN
ncbi:hypothetical protein DFS33DRAFT_1270775 [Desarmillaria ectypa]|nr:hypothetical protein DFS33DRAFT_1270775 [Desarmillaria ectypa]